MLLSAVSPSSPRPPPSSSWARTTHSSRITRYSFNSLDLQTASRANNICPRILRRIDYHYILLRHREFELWRYFKSYRVNFLFHILTVARTRSRKATFFTRLSSTHFPILGCRYPNLVGYWCPQSRYLFLETLLGQQSKSLI
jgi:hypothetical protein